MTKIDSRFGQEMRRLREAKGISQRKLGEKVGLGSGYISRIERAEFKPPSEVKIVAIADALDGNKDYMLSLAGKISSDVMDAVKKRPEKMSEAVRSIDNIGDDSTKFATTLLGFILLFGGIDDEKNNEKSDKLMFELRKVIEDLPREKQMNLIRQVRSLMDSWEKDVKG